MLNKNKLHSNTGNRIFSQRAVLQTYRVKAYLDMPLQYNSICFDSPDFIKIGQICDHLFTQRNETS